MTLDASHVMQSLFDAASRGDAPQTKKLLKKGTPPDAMDPNGDTPLLCAAQGDE
jgi:ankyrin repeat protein